MKIVWCLRSIEEKVGKKMDAKFGAIVDVIKIFLVNVQEIQNKDN